MVFRTQVKTTAYYKPCPIQPSGNLSNACTKTSLTNTTTIIRGCTFDTRHNGSAVTATTGFDMSCVCLDCDPTVSIICTCYNDGCNGSESAKTFTYLELGFVVILGSLYSNLSFCRFKFNLIWFVQVFRGSIGFFQLMVLNNKLSKNVCTVIRSFFCS